MAVDVVLLVLNLYMEKPGVDVLKQLFTQAVHSLTQVQYQLYHIDCHYFFIFWNEHNISVSKFVYTIQYFH